MVVVVGAGNFFIFVTCVWSPPMKLSLMSHRDVRGEKVIVITSYYRGGTLGKKYHITHETEPVGIGKNKYTNIHWKFSLVCSIHFYKIQRTIFFLF